MRVARDVLVVGMYEVQRPHRRELGGIVAEELLAGGRHVEHLTGDVRAHDEIRRVLGEQTVSCLGLRDCDEAVSGLPSTKKEPCNDGYQEERESQQLLEEELALDGPVCLILAQSADDPPPRLRNPSSGGDDRHIGDAEHRTRCVLALRGKAADRRRIGPRRAKLPRASARKFGRREHHELATDVLDELMARGFDPTLLAQHQRIERLIRIDSQYHGAESIHAVIATANDGLDHGEQLSVCRRNRADHRALAGTRGDDRGSTNRGRERVGVMRHRDRRTIGT